ncbi:hypothetical protein RWK44_28440 [Rhizobium sp. 25PS6]|uniref:PAS domain-containing protein n=1 Tax=Rhizobium laguerreae TaxID=1076926 RepID=A0AAJ3E0L2_9HYPH|nr:MULTISPECIES: hypothetical protein [Rhizobium]MBY3165552.1 hypothetical protein [Rhizobium laguerreae]MBY3321913.1 hypothetical protein [Rhizobium laguerreae]MBY3363293.1 hypothetical protein [Rhizobium laguerreae]MDU0364323.1 hypothetical protein [Rhizobium sp. 25PS6]NKM89378.1 hypothetical protein [Rhizobium laguerreae]
MLSPVDFPAERIQQILNSAVDTGIITLDANGNITSWSKCAERVSVILSVLEVWRSNALRRLRLASHVTSLNRFSDATCLERADANRRSHQWSRPRTTMKTNSA